MDFLHETQVQEPDLIHKTHSNSTSAASALLRPEETSAVQQNALDIMSKVLCCVLDVGSPVSMELCCVCQAKHSYSVQAALSQCMQLSEAEFRHVQQEMEKEARSNRETIAVDDAADAPLPEREFSEQQPPVIGNVDRERDEREKESAQRVDGRRIAVKSGHEVRFFSVRFRVF